MDKKGVSAIVATVLLVLVTVAGVTIVWAGIVPMIRNSASFEGSGGRIDILSSGGYTAYDSSKNVSSIHIKRSLESESLTKVKIVFYFDGQSYSTILPPPEQGGTRAYIFNMTNWGEPETVSAAPIYSQGSGEVEGELVPEISLLIKSLGTLPTDIYEIGEDYS